MAELFDESHFFICSNGLKPARLKANQGVCLQVSKNHYLTIFSLKCKGVDFSCRWVALLYAIVAAALALLCSCPVGWVLLAAILGAAVGAGLGAMLCGDMAAIMRVWVVIKTDARISTYEIAPNRPGVHLTCSAFGGQITYAPNVKSEFHAWVLFAGNTLLTGLEGFMYVYAARGVGMLVTKPLAFFANFGVNYLKTLTVKGAIGRAIFGVWGGFSAYSNSDREGFHWDEILSEAGKSAAFVETAIYNAVTKGDFHSIVMLLSMGGIPGARESNYKSVKELGTNKAKWTIEAKKLGTELKNEAKATKDNYKKFIDKAKEYRNQLRDQKNGVGAGEKLFDTTSYKMTQGEKLGDFGEKVAEDYYRSKGYDKFYEVQNASGNGVDIVARNSRTGDMIKVEVKATQQERLWNNGEPKEIPMSKDQREMKGKDYTNNRLNRAAREEDGYTDGKSSTEAKEALKAQREAKKNGSKVETEKLDIYVDQNGNMRGDPVPREW